MTVYFHAGLPKTGSKAVQNACFRNREKLAATGLNYWSIDAVHSWPLRLMFSTSKKNSQKNWAAMSAKFGSAQDIRAHMLAEMTGDFLVSAESAGVLENAVLSKLAHLWGKTRCIIYVREPRGWYTSAVQQKMKYLGLEAAIDAVLKGVTFRQRVENLQKVFDTDVRLYSSDTLLVDFAEAIGRPGLVLDTERENASPSATAVWLLEAVHRDGGLGHTGWLRDMVRDFGGAPFRLPQAAMDRILSARAADIDWISQLVGKDLLQVEGPECRDDGRLDNHTAELLNTMAREICELKRQVALYAVKKRPGNGDDSAAARAKARVDAYEVS